MAPSSVTNVADIAASHIIHLNRIPGIKVPENGWSISVPGRQLLASQVIFGEKGTLSYRQRANGIVLLQCVDFFVEFLPGGRPTAPAALDNEEYENQFWTLIKDVLPYDEPKLTRNVFKHVHGLLIDARRRYTLAHPLREIGGIAKDEKFFLTFIDEHVAHCTYSFSEAQLKYGQRRDDDFAMRLATRVRQWRHLTRNKRNFQTLLYMWPVLTMDVAPFKEWDSKFLKEASSYATRFQKPEPPVLRASPYVDLSPDSDNSRELSTISRMSTQMAVVTRLIIKVEANMANIKDDVAEMGKDVKDLRESNSGIFKTVNYIKTHFNQGWEKIVRRDSAKKEEETVSNKRPRTRE